MAAAGRVFSRLSGVALGAAVLTLSKQKNDNYTDNKLSTGSELILVQIAFRHGARTPLFPSPVKELESVTWKPEILLGVLPHTSFEFELKDVLGGARPFSLYDERQMRRILKGGSMYGQLTKLGQQQMYNLGKRHGVWYIDELKFLRESFNPKDVYIRTTNIQRTIDSARCVLAGMFGKEKLKGEVVIYTKDEKNEILYPNVYCGFFKRWLDYAKVHAALHIKGYLARQEEIEKDLELTPNRGRFFAVPLRDIVVAMIAHDMEVPPKILQKWTKIEKQALEDLIAIQCGLPYRRKEVLKVGIGKFLEEINDNIQKKLAGKNQYKMMLYSVHDTSIVALLLALGLFDDQWPDFAADLVFELYKNKNQDFYIRVLYKGEEKVLPGCSSPFCPLNTFKELVSQHFIDDWEKECQVVIAN